MKKILILILLLTTNEVFSQFCENFNQYENESHINSTIQIEYNILDNWGSICSTVGYNNSGSINGQNDHFLHFIDQPCGNGASWIFNSTDFSTNWLQGQQFSFDFIIFDGGQTSSTTETIYIYNGSDPTSSSLVARFVLNNPITINDGWTTITPYIAMMNQGGLPSNSTGYWEMTTGSDWDNLIQNVGGLGFNLDLNNGGEAFGLDNICMHECDLSFDELFQNFPLCYDELPFVTSDDFLGSLYLCEINGVTVMDFNTGYLDPQYFSNGNFILDSPGEYVIEMYLEDCYLVYEIEISPEIIIDLPLSYVACNGIFEEVCAPSGSNYTYQWYGPHPNPSINESILLWTDECYTPDQVGGFNLVITDEFGCVNSHPFTVYEETPLPLLGEDGFLCIGDLVELENQIYNNPNYTINWYHSNNLVQVGGMTLQNSYTSGTITVEISYADCHPVSSSAMLIECCPEDLELSIDCANQQIVIENLPESILGTGVIYWFHNGVFISKPNSILSNSINTYSGSGTYEVYLYFPLPYGQECEYELTIEYDESYCCDLVGPIANAHFESVESYQVVNTIPYGNVEIPRICDFILDATNSSCEEEYIINIAILNPVPWTTQEVFPWTAFSGQAGIIDLANFVNFQPGQTYLLSFHAGPNGTTQYLPFTYGLDAEVELLNANNYTILEGTIYGNVEVAEYLCRDIILDGSASTCEDSYQITIAPIDPIFPNWNADPVFYNEWTVGQAPNNISVPTSAFNGQPTGYYLVTFAVGPIWTPEYKLIWWKECDSFQRISEMTNRFSVNDINSEVQISVYPNPTNDLITISTNFESGNYQVLDVNGKVIKDGMVLSNETTIDLSGSSSGIYFIQVINSEKQVFFDKVIKN